MTLKEQATLVTSQLNDLALSLYQDGENEEYDIQFLISDNFQEFEAIKLLNNRKYIPGILNRMDPFVPKDFNSVLVDYLEVIFYTPVEHNDAVEHVINLYQATNHNKTFSMSGTVFTQFIGKQVFEYRDRSQDGYADAYQISYLRMEWDEIISGVAFEQTSLTIGGVVYPVNQQTYRNDKSTIANRQYDAAGNTNLNLVSEELIITVPLNAVTAGSALWQDVHGRTFNKTYTIIDNYGAGGVITKTWELKSGIVNKEQNKIVSFTLIFDIPLPRATVVITHRPLTGTPTTGSPIIVSFSEGGSNSLDARMKDRLVKANELRQGNAYSISFIYDSSEIAKILAYRAHRKVDGDRFDITYTFNDLTFVYENLVLESGSHAWIDNPGLAFTVNFVEGL